MTLSYPLESEKGLFFGLFWLIFNLGGVIGGLIAMGINLHENTEGETQVSASTYFTFCGLMLGGTVVALLFVIRPSQVVKTDGSSVSFERAQKSHWKSEIKEIGKLFTNKYMLLLTPLIIQSNVRSVSSPYYLGSIYLPLISYSS